MVAPVASPSPIKCGRLWVVLIIAAVVLCRVVGVPLTTRAGGRKMAHGLEVEYGTVEPLGPTLAAGPDAGLPRRLDGADLPLLRPLGDSPSDSDVMSVRRGGALPSVALQGVFVGPTGSDGTGCGSTAAAPCATLAYAINEIANSVQPREGMVEVFVASGSYGPAGCGAQATRPVRVTGGGSGTTTVDCGDQSQLLATNSSIVVAGLTIVGCRTTSMSVVPGTGGALSVGGGAAIAAVWPPDLDDAVADLSDVYGAHNVASLVPVGPADAVAYAGGGAVLVVGGGARVSVTLRNTAFVNNTVVVNASQLDPAAFLRVGGGALCLLPALGVFQGQAAVGTSVVVESLNVTGNTAGCPVCSNGKQELVTASSTLGEDLRAPADVPYSRVVAGERCCLCMHPNDLLFFCVPC